MTQSARVAWITGASAGIGRALALRLARDGWRVAASARREGELRALAAEAAGLRGEIRPYPLDVTDGRGVAEAIAAIEREMGPVTLAVLNAGTHRPMPAAQFSAMILRDLLMLNVLGVAYGLESLLPRMLARRGGRILVVASLAGYGGLPSASAYGASKAALINMAEALRPELLEQGVVLQVVNPGFVKTPLTDRNDFPMPFLISAEQAADAIARGIESDRFEITFPWFFSRLVKLLRLLPYGLYFRLTRRMVRS